jgi:DNA primase
VSGKYVSKEDVTNGINILNIAKEFGIETESVSSGNFDHRCKCPSSNHKGGTERTGSLYIDSKENNFYCFGCSAGFNCIDFYMLCTDLTFLEALSDLKKRVKPGTIRSGYYKVETNNFYILLQISNLFRKTMQNHKNDLKWINDLMIYSDKFIFNLDPKDDQAAKELYKKINKVINKRYSQ